MLAGATGLEPAASCVTGRRSNQLNYAPAFKHSLPFPFLSSCTRNFPKMPESCRDSKSETRKLLESGGTDGSLQRPEEGLGTLIAP
jgi:hypothetical protein